MGYKLKLGWFLSLFVFVWLAVSGTQSAMAASSWQNFKVTATGGYKSASPVVVDSSGTKHNAWITNDFPINSSTLYYANSGNPTPLAIATTVGGNSTPSIFVTSNNVVYVAWVDKRNGPDGDGNGWDVYYATSADNWVNHLVTTGPTTACSNPMIAVGSDGNIHLAYIRATTPGDDQLFYANQSGNWAETRVSWTNSCIQTADMALASNGTIHLTFSDNGNINHVYYANSSTGWLNQQIDTDSTDNWWDDRTAPVIAVGSDNVVHIAWEDARNTDTNYNNGQIPNRIEIYYANSATGWTNTEIAAPFDSGVTAKRNPSILVDQAGLVHLAWLQYVVPNSSIANLYYGNSADWQSSERVTDLENAIICSDPGDIVCTTPLSLTLHRHGLMIDNGKPAILWLGKDSRGDELYHSLRQTSPLTIETASLPRGAVNSPYAATPAVSGGTPPYSWSVTNLPVGLFSSPSGMISGTPATAGRYLVNLSVTDFYGMRADRMLSVIVDQQAAAAGWNIASVSPFSIYDGHNTMTADGQINWPAAQHGPVTNGYIRVGGMTTYGVYQSVSWTPGQYGAVLVFVNGDGTTALTVTYNEPIYDNSTPPNIIGSTPIFSPMLPNLTDKVGQSIEYFSSWPPPQPPAGAWTIASYNPNQTSNIDWPIAQHNPVAYGNYLKVGTTYYHVIYSGTAPPWESFEKQGSHVYADLQQCDQLTGVPLTVPTPPGMPLYADMTGSAGQAITLYNSWTQVPPPTGPTPDLIASGQLGWGGSINSLGEAVWSQFDPATGRNQIFSSVRGQLTSEPVDHNTPVINNLGDLIWTEASNTNNSFQLKGTIAGQPVTVMTSSNSFGKIDLNDRGEVIWTQQDASSGNSQIFSNLRGQLTNDASYHYDPSINNQGDIVFISFGAQPYFQVYKLTAGSALPVPVTNDSLEHRNPAINDSGDIVWAEHDMAVSGAPTRLVSKDHGTLLTMASSPMALDLNNCGDIVYLTWENDQNRLYRLGGNAPCMSYPAANDTPAQASPVAFGNIFTGVTDSTTNPIDWYRFEATAGDSIRITVNYDRQAQHYLNIGLYDGNNSLLNEQTSLYPLAINTTATYSGSYYLKIEGMGGRFGYSVSLSKSSSNCGAGPCPDLIASGQLGWGGSINSLGEAVWSQFDPATGRNQIFSSVRGQLTSEPVDHNTPVINNLGDLIWTEASNTNNSFQLKGTIAGQPVTVMTSSNSFGKIDLNDRGEVIWTQQDASSGNSQIFSNLRGQLTNDASYHYDPSINNQGDIVFISFGAQPYFQVYKLTAGSALPVPVTNDSLEHRNPAINDSGDIVWAEHDMAVSGAPTRLVSKDHGTLLTMASSPMALDLNNCGDIVYLTWENDQNRLYRLGGNAPCMSYPAANDTPAQASPVAFGNIFTGVTDSTTNPIDWYRFEATAGDSIRITVNYDRQAQHYLNIGLYDGNNSLLNEQTSLYPLAINTTATYSGSYYLKIEGMGGRFGYSVSLSKSSSNCGAGPCPDLIASGQLGWGGSINSLGEAVWSQFDPATGRNQIFSSVRGQLTSEPVDHNTPVINNLGDLIWTEASNTNNSFQLKGTIAGQPVTVMTSSNSFGKIDLNDRGEVIWTQQDASSGNSQIFSNLRGQLTNDASYHYDPSINNQGDIVFISFGAQPYFQVYKLTAGSALPVPVTNDSLEHRNPAINDSGDIVWAEHDMAVSGAPTRLVSKDHGTLLTMASSPMALDLNNCGDIVYLTWENDQNRLYRLGGNAPCMSYPAANDTPAQASPVAFGNIFTGVTDSTTNPIDWYRFEATAGDSIRITVNYDRQAQHYLNIGLYDGNNSLLNEQTSLYPLAINTTATYSGSYYLKIEGMGGRFGYSVSLSKSSSNCGAGPCPDLIASGQLGWGGSINSLGEAVWSQFDPATGRNQIFSSVRGQLTSEPVDHNTPVINNLGDLIWTEASNTNNSFQLKGTIAGQPVTVMTSSNSFGKIDLNDRGEVIWTQQDASSGNSQIFSNLRGQLTNDASYHYDPSINNQGDIVFISFGAQPYFQVYKLTAGSALPVPVTNDSLEHRNPAINDSGDIVWAEHDMAVSGAPTRLVSKDHGTLLTMASSPMALDLNNCGDIVYLTWENDQNRLYRLGGTVACMTPPQREFALKVNLFSDGNGAGTVASLPAGLSVRWPETSTYGFFTANSEVTLTAVPADGSAIMGWGGACAGVSGLSCTVTMGGVRDVSVMFAIGTVSAPAAITVPAGSTTGSYTVSWAASSTTGATYTLEESTDNFATYPSNSTTITSGLAALSATVSGKTSGTYSYRVKAVKAPMVESGWVTGANGCGVTVTLAAPAYTFVAATNTTGTVGVAWGASAVAGVTYILEESTSAAFTTSTQLYSGTDTTVNLPGHLNGTYYYRVKVTRTGYNDSAWKAAPNGCVVTAILAAPAYTYVASSNTTGTIGVSWGEAAVAGVTYILEESTSAAFTTSTQLYSGTATTINLPGHSNGTYYYRVKATLAGHTDSAWKAAPNGCTVSVTLAAPSWTYVQPTNTTGNITVAWGASAVAGVTYILEESTSAAFATSSQVYSGTETTASLPGHLNGTYYYRVKVTRTGNNSSDWNASAGCTVTVTLAAPAWTYVQPANSTGNVAVAWSAAAVAGVTYILEESDSAVFTTSSQVYSGTATTVTLPGRINGTYYYRVKFTKTGYNDSAWKDAPNGCTVTVTLAAPSWTYVQATNSTGTIGVAWGASAVAGVTYILEESTSAAFTTSSQVYSGTATTTSLPGHINGTYYYRVKVNKTGYIESAWKAAPSGCTVTLP